MGVGIASSAELASDEAHDAITGWQVSAPGPSGEGETEDGWSGGVQFGLGGFGSVASRSSGD